MMKVYKHTQVGTFLIICYSAVSIFLGVLNILTDFHPIALLGLISMLIVLGLFATLTVQIVDRMIKIHFGIGLIRKGFHLKDIETYRVVENPWYYGWGIRFTPGGWLYGVSGLSAIELQMKSGVVYRIGTDEPDSLAKALDEAINAPTND